MFRGQKRDQYCFDDTQMCVEGYPSSANTFVYNVLTELWPNATIAHHTHTVANIKRAIRYDIPPLILFRHPSEAIPSFVARFPPSLRDAVQRYILFYDYVLSISDKAVLVEFDEVTENIGAVVRRYSQAVNVDVPDFDEEALSERAFKKIQQWQAENSTQYKISLPNEKRDDAKDQLRQELMQMDEYQGCESLYDQLVACHNDVLTK
jgi:hypothetical protein